MARGIIVWLLIMAIETVSGILRGLFLAPVVGEITANRIGWPVGALIVLGITYSLFDWMGMGQKRELVLLGAIWAVLTLLFEAMIGFARSLTALDVIADFNPLSGRLGAYTVLFMLAAPWLAAKLRRS
jgi:hypothetical protein